MFCLFYFVFVFFYTYFGVYFQLIIIIIIINTNLHAYSNINSRGKHKCNILKSSLFILLGADPKINVEGKTLKNNSRDVPVQQY